MSLNYEDFPDMPAHVSVLLDTSHPSVLISVRTAASERMSRVSGGSRRWSSGKEETSHWGLCAERRSSGAKIRPENETSASFASQLSATGLFCGLYQHAGNDSPWQRKGNAWQHPLLLKKSWAASLMIRQLEIYRLICIPRETLELTSTWLIYIT